MKLQWREFSLGMKMLTIVAVLSWCVFGAALLTVGNIETTALSQPSIADTVFRHPHEIKGDIRFFTDRQEYVYAAVKPTMIVTFVITAILFYACNRLHNRLETEKKQKIMDKIITDSEQSC